jgi:hypothetical protein
MSTKTDDLKQLNEVLREVREKRQSLLKDVFSEKSQIVFAANPGLESFTWKQYTPYFNDGDACHFRVHKEEINLVLNGEEAEEVYFSSYSKNKENNPLYPIWQDIQSIFEGYEPSDLEEMFGDHVKVTVTPNGAETQEYNHD